MNTPHLKKLYHKFNANYFDGTLPECTVRFDASIPLNNNGQTVVQEVDGELIFLIKIDPHLRGHSCLYQIILLHEMCHIHLYPYLKHGKKFKDEIRRLIGRGAFDELL